MPRVRRGSCASHACLRPTQAFKEAQKAKKTALVLAHTAVNISEGKRVGGVLAPDHATASVQDSRVETILSQIKDEQCICSAGVMLTSTAVEEQFAGKFPKLKMTLSREVVGLDMEASAFLRAVAGVEGVVALGVIKGAIDCGTEWSRKGKDTATPRCVAAAFRAACRVAVSYFGATSGLRQETMLHREPLRLRSAQCAPYTLSSPCSLAVDRGAAARAVRREVLQDCGAARRPEGRTAHRAKEGGPVRAAVHWCWDAKQGRQGEQGSDDRDDK